MTLIHYSFHTARRMLQKLATLANEIRQSGASTSMGAEEIGKQSSQIRQHPVPSAHQPTASIDPKIADSHNNHNNHNNQVDGVMQGVTPDAADNYNAHNFEADNYDGHNYEAGDDLAEQNFKRSPINWIPAGVLVATPIAAAVIAPWYLATHKVSPATWAVFGLVGAWTGLSITAGYHRLMSHRAYKAHPAVRNFFLVGATLAVQGSAFNWCSGHRTHHKHVDDRMQDPYSAKRGFWFSHIGWMLKKYPSGNFDYKNIRDLTQDKVLQIQHKYYGLWVVAANVGLIGAIGWLIGDVKGTLLLAGLVRLVLNHHLTFFINSLCHMYGTRPYTDTNSARDNFLLAIPTWGEGYHNYHHFFQYDYRNGVKWWHYDPTKWLIATLSQVGLASDLRTVDTLKIKHAEVNMLFKRALHKVDTLTSHSDSAADQLTPSALQKFSQRIMSEHVLFNETVQAWQALKTEAMAMKKNEFAERLHEVDELLKGKRKLIEQRIKAHQYNVHDAFFAIRQRPVTV